MLWELKYQFMPYDTEGARVRYLSMVKVGRPMEKLCVMPVCILSQKSGSRTSLALKLILFCNVVL